MTLSRHERRRHPRPGRHLPPWQVDLGGVCVEHASLVAALLLWLHARECERRVLAVREAGR